MDDFNQMCTDLESSLNTAQSTANTARQEAAVLPYAVGTYTGDSKTKTITAGILT